MKAKRTMAKKRHTMKKDKKGTKGKGLVLTSDDTLGPFLATTMTKKN